MEAILIDSSLFPEYDSLRLYYGIKIKVPKWSDEHHDLLHIEPIPNDERESPVLWSSIDIRGFSRNKSKWRGVCDIGYDMDSTDWSYYPIMKYLTDSIMSLIGERLYYVDEFYWSKDRDYYLTMTGCYYVWGTIKLR